MARYWYSYLGGSGTTPQKVAANYALISIKPDCIGVNDICTIYARAGGPNPSSPLSSNLQNYIAAALASTSLNAFPQAPNKAFVYKRA